MIHNLLEFIKNIFLIGFIDPDSIVRYGNDQVIVDVFQSNINLSLIRITEFNGIGYQVHHGLDQLVPISFDGPRCVRQVDLHSYMTVIHQLAGGTDRILHHIL